MRLRHALLLILGIAFASAGAVARADTPAAAVAAIPADGDVTMTVIPSGEDVVKTVVQNISVPSNASKLAKGKGPEQRKAPAAAGQDSEAAERAAQQVAEQAAQHQAGQTQQQVTQQAQQAQQQAESAVAAPKTPPHPPRG